MEFFDKVYKKITGAASRTAKEGEKLKEKAVYVPEEMQGCIPLSETELQQLKALLDKALKDMKVKG